MDDWHAPKSNTRIILSLISFAAAFIFMAWFFKYAPFSPSDRLVGWLGAITTCFLFFSGFYIGFSIKTKKAIVGFLAFLIWSLGLLFLPVPEGYAEAVYGSWAILFMAAVALYAKYEESRKRKGKPKPQNEQSSKTDLG
jgi:hypothetical protein